jgi:hypothetical protein
VSAERRAWLERRAAPLALGLILLGWLALYLYVARDLTFYQDTWAFLMDRRSFDADSLLLPHNEHIVLIPVLLEQLQLALFGMTTAWSEYVLLVLLECATVALLFVYVRRRAGDWVALIFAALLLLVGPAWETLLWPFEICFVGSVLFGIAMLLALERETRRGDVAACVFLAISLGFNSLGLAFVAGAAVDVLQRHRQRGWRRAWVFAIPLLLFIAWYLGWGHEASNSLTLRNVLGAPRFVMESFAASLEALLGLTDTVPGQASSVSWGQPLAIAFLVLVGVWLWRGGRVHPRLWPALAIAVAAWTLTALNHSPAREPTTSRYLYASAALTLLVAANLLWNVRLSRRTLAIAGFLAAAAILANLGTLKDGAGFLKNQSVLTKADLGAMEIGRGTISPYFVPVEPVAGTPSLINVEAQKLFEAVDEYGSPAYTDAELAAAPAPGPKYADSILASALPLSTTTELQTYDSGPTPGNCVDFSGAELSLGPGTSTIEVAPGPPASFSLRRFASGEYPVKTEGAPGESTTELTIPADRSRRPWFLTVEAQQPVRVCPGPH